jgi:hypothetical protein
MKQCNLSCFLVTICNYMQLYETMKLMQLYATMQLMQLYATVLVPQTYIGTILNHFMNNLQLPLV